MEKLNSCLSSLRSVKDGRVSRSRVDAVAEAAAKALKSGKSAGEVAEAIVLHAKSSTKDQRLAAIYALHAAVWNEKEQLEEKNTNHRTEKRGNLSIALEQKVESVMALIKDCQPKDREQVSKILQKWSERYVFPADICRKCALAANCNAPTAPAPSSPISSRRKKEPDTTTAAQPPPFSSAIQPVILSKEPPPPLTTVTRIERLEPLTEKSIIPPRLVPPPSLTTTASSTGKSSGWGAYGARRDDRKSERRGRSEERREKKSRWDS